MPTTPTLPPKPQAEIIRPEITFAPRFTIGRQLARRGIKSLTRFLVWMWLKLTVSGVENIPAKGPALLVFNHLGDADAVVLVATLPAAVESFGKSELYDYPLLGWIMRAYGIIWLHRGTADRRALRAALQMLDEGRFFCIAPEGRESLSGSLEEGTQGAAYLALKTGAPLIPITITGTENSRVYGNMKRLRRTTVTFTVGKPFHLEIKGDRRQALHEGTQQIMQVLADQLPEEYRGEYGGGGENRE